MNWVYNCFLLSFGLTFTVNDLAIKAVSTDFRLSKLLSFNYDLIFKSKFGKEFLVRLVNILLPFLRYYGIVD